jgi:cytochrome c oxidase subunit II
VLSAGACSGRQSALDPAGPIADSIHTLSLVMYAGAAAVTVLVTVLMIAPFLRRGSAASASWRPSRRVFLVGGGVLLPGITLTVLLIYTSSVGHEMRAAAPNARVTIDATGHIYWWDIAYRRPSGGEPIVSANEVRLPAGEPVEIHLRSADVIHSFWIPSLAGKTDMIPGLVNRMVIEADRPGIYRGVCAEYCGAQHALMAFDVIVMEPAAFEAWLEREGAPAREPQTETLQQGRDLFVRGGCGSCHTVRGVSTGKLGPDLTRVGARRTIAAGTLPNGVGPLAGWIASAQHLKPGNRMPSFGGFDGPQLRALASYMDSLR